MFTVTDFHQHFHRLTKSVQPIAYAVAAHRDYSVNVTLRLSRPAH